jgi:hypothetical protein
MTTAVQQCQQLGLAPYDPATGHGLMRHLIIRSAGGWDASTSSAPAGAPAGAPDESGATSTSSAPAGAPDESGATSTSSAPAGAPDESGATSARSAPAGPTAASSSCGASGSSGRRPVEFMVVLVTARPCPSQQLAPLARALVAAHAAVVSVHHSVDARPPLAAPAPLAAADAAAEAATSVAGRTGAAGAGSAQRAGSKQQQRGRGGLRDGRASPGGDAADGGGGGGGRYAGGPLRVASTQLLLGREQLVESLCGLEFAISPHSFFQTNAAQAEALYRLVGQAAGLAEGGTDVVLDLYCGTGTIGLTLAARAARVVGFDVSESAVADARANAARNGVGNALFVCGDLDELAGQLAASTSAASPGGGGAQARAPTKASRPGTRAGGPGRGRGRNPPPGRASLGGVQVPRPDVVVVDPARSGLGLPVVAFLRACGARRLVYVSCNPASLARDVARLCAADVGRGAGGAAYRLVSVTPLDMYPQTEHVEAVAVLDRG